MGVQIDEFRINGVVVPWLPVPPDSPLTAQRLACRCRCRRANPSSSLSSGTSTSRLRTNTKGRLIQPALFIGYFFPRITPYNDTDLVPALPGFDTEDFTYRLGREAIQ